MTGGTVNISRSLWDDEAFADAPFSEREAWIWMIAEASWKPRKRRIGDYIITLGRGQLAGSIRFFAKAWQWTPAKVQRFLDRVQKMDLIRRKTDTGVTVVTICKYDDYQHKPKASDTGPIQVRYTSDTNENKGERRGKEGEEVMSPSGDLLHANPAAEAIRTYNAAAERHGWPQVQKVTPSRRKALLARINEAGGAEGWEVAMKRAEDSDFLCGRTSKAWTGFSFDWVCKAANFTKLMEGNYDNRGSAKAGRSPHGGNGGGGHSSALDAIALAARDR